MCVVALDTVFNLSGNWGGGGGGCMSKLEKLSCCGG